ncbi:hypothetical protein LSTR_LSTR000942 [Laodelphax striatellus]|uniref:C2H2-type domain-containing protein n=1 Tax=Laodelphax striatellus TaxID=195883 RepID=A0A482X2G1_LAOST|nr:hypothetical protein LSTR_LSTR000942 [Laodelphax striatellus]
MTTQNIYLYQRSTVNTIFIGSYQKLDYDSFQQNWSEKLSHNGDDQNDGSKEQNSIDPVTGRSKLFEGPGSFPCRICGRVYKWRRTLHNHYLYECGKSPSFKCPYCDQMSKRKSNITVHIKNQQFVPKIEKFQCNFCKRSYKWRQSLDRHLKHECGKDPIYACSQCKFQAKHKTSLQRHFQSFHAASLRTQPQIVVQEPNSSSGTHDGNDKNTIVSKLIGYWCNRCFRVYRYKKTLSRHMRLECGVSPQFKCSLCPYMAKRHDRLLVHMAVRHGFT